MGISTCTTQSPSYMCTVYSQYNSINTACVLSQSTFDASFTDSCLLLVVDFIDLLSQLQKSISILQVFVVVLGHSLEPSIGTPHCTSQDARVKFYETSALTGENCDAVSQPCHPQWCQCPLHLAQPWTAPPPPSPLRCLRH